MTPRTEFENHAQGSRTSLRRGLIALIAAPILVLAPLCVLLLAVAIGGPSDPRVSLRDSSGLLLPAAMALAMTEAMALVFGGPVWIALRLLRRESARIYAVAGLALGRLWGLWFGYSGAGPLRVDQTLAFGFCGAVGCVVAVGFWRMARDPHT
jgi:hypothetical protein